jgi:hypothetical protein
MFRVNIALDEFGRFAGEQFTVVCENAHFRDGVFYLKGGERSWTRESSRFAMNDELRFADLI